MLFFGSGVDETLRVNGRARLTSDPQVLDRTTVASGPSGPLSGMLVRPKLAVVVAVTECFVHRGKALRRAGLWDMSAWLPVAARPSAAAILTNHLSLDVDPAVVEADLEEGYRTTMWLAGG